MVIKYSTYMMLSNYITVIITNFYRHVTAVQQVRVRVKRLV